MASNATRSGDRSSVDCAGSPSSARPEHVADYIVEITAELAELARSQRLELLAYLLEMARLEASSHKPRDPGRAASVT